MTDHQADQGARPVDRLPDVRPSRDGPTYTAYGPHRLADRSRRLTASDVLEEPAWWERDEAAHLPDARPWRAGSIVSAHLPRPLRRVLDEGAARSASRTTSWSFDAEPDRVLGGSRLGPDDEIPVLSREEIARERSSWRDERDRETGKRGKRPKPGRRERRDDAQGRRQGRSR